MDIFVLMFFLVGVGLGYIIGSSPSAVYPAEIKLVLTPPTDGTAVAPVSLPGITLPISPEFSTDVVAFCEQWADEWAQDSCKARAAHMYAENSDWSAVLARLVREDGS